MAKTVLVGGGTGFIGSVLCRGLAGLGFSVKLISRQQPVNDNMMTWKLLEEYGLPDNCSAVVNLAGANVFNPRFRWKADFQNEVVSSRLHTTHTLAKAIDEASVKPDVFVSMSGVGYYKPSLTAEYTEDSPGGNCDFLSKLAASWEDAAKLKTKDTRHVIIRSGVVLGRQGGVIRNMYWPFFFGFGGPLASGKQYFPWIHIHDLVGLILFSIEKTEVKGVLNGVAPQIITNKQFSSAFGKALLRPAIIPMPELALNIIFSAERAKMLADGHKVIPKRVLQYGFDYDFTDIDSACESCAHMTLKADEQPFIDAPMTR